MSADFLTQIATGDGAQYAWLRQNISATAPCLSLDRCSRRDSTSPIHGVVHPASMQSKISVQPHQTGASPSRHQRGLTLVELMIAMLLGLFLIGGLLQIFISSKQTYRMQEGLSRLQENGRFAMDFITRDIRLAGFLGCQEAATDPHTIPNVVPDPVTAGIPRPTNANIIRGDDAISTTAISPTWASWSGAAPCDSKCIAGTDAISMRHADSCGGYLKEPAPASGEITIAGTNSCGINVNDALIIAGCNNADIFRAAADSTNTIIKHAPLTALYNRTNTELFMYRDHSYFIRTSTGSDCNGVNKCSLWLLDNTQATGGNNPVELVEGIENMQILYGVDTNGDRTANYYVKADEVVQVVPPVDWDKVVSVRISLLVATIDDNLADQPLSYTYNGATVLSTDRKIRRVFNSTIALRNLVP